MLAKVFLMFLNNIIFFNWYDLLRLTKFTINTNIGNVKHLRHNMVWWQTGPEGQVWGQERVLAGFSIWMNARKQQNCVTAWKLTDTTALSSSVTKTREKSGTASVLRHTSQGSPPPPPGPGTGWGRERRTARRTRRRRAKWSPPSRDEREYFPD